MQLRDCIFIRERLIGRCVLRLALKSLTSWAYFKYWGPKSPEIADFCYFGIITIRYPYTCEWCWLCFFVLFRKEEISTKKKQKQTNNREVRHRCVYGSHRGSLFAQESILNTAINFELDSCAKKWASVASLDVDIYIELLQASSWWSALLIVYQQCSKTDGDYVNSKCLRGLRRLAFGMYILTELF